MLPISLVLSLASKLAYLAFVAMLIVFFAIRYIPQASASGLYPRFAALAGTFLSLGYVLLPPQEVSTPLYVISLLLMIVGFVLATWATFSLGRSISIVPQARQLVTTGAYSFVRHPIYLGEMAAAAGIALHSTVRDGLSCSLYYNARSSSGASKMRNGYCWEFFLHMQNTQRGSRG